MPVVTRRYPYIVTSYPSLPLYLYVVPVVSSQPIVTDSVVTRRYRLHRYRGAVVTRRYLIVGLSLPVVSRRYLTRALSLRLPSLPLISPSLPLGSPSLHLISLR